MVFVSPYLYGLRFSVVRIDTDYALFFARSPYLYGLRFSVVRIDTDYALVFHRSPYLYGLRFSVVRNYTDYVFSEFVCIRTTRPCVLAKFYCD